MRSAGRRLCNGFPTSAETIVVQTIPAQLIQMERHSMKQMFILVLAAVTAACVIASMPLPEWRNASSGVVKPSADSLLPRGIRRPAL